MLTKEKVQSYKEKLEKEREKLLKEIKTGETPPDFGADVDSFDEESDEAEEFGNELAVTHVMRERLSRVETALEKIRSGAFGACKSCGGTIDEQVLDLTPESEFCRACKQKSNGK